MPRSAALAASLTTDQVLRLRAGAQRLSARTAGIVAAARAVCGAQAQDAPAAALSLRARIDSATGVTAPDIERVRMDDRALVRTWLMRGTIHLVTTADLPLLLPLVGPHFAQRGRQRRLQLGLDDATAERGVAALCAALAAEGPLTREALRARLVQRGIPAEGQALVHLAQLAALQGHVCFGPGAGRQSTFVLLRDWLEAPVCRAVAQPPPQADALAELARRYLNAFGPARPEDLAAWSGLPISQVRAGWARVERDLVEVVVPPAAGGHAWILASHAGRLAEVTQATRGESAERVALLAAWDAYLMGYRSRALAVGSADVGRVVASGGMIYPTVTVEGRIAAIWRAQQRRRQLTVTLEPLELLSACVCQGVEQEARDVARFLGADGASLAETDATGATRAAGAG
jgi:hypothetical protein